MLEMTFSGPVKNCSGTDKSNKQVRIMAMQQNNETATIENGTSSFRQAQSSSVEPI